MLTGCPIWYIRNNFGHVFVFFYYTILTYLLTLVLLYNTVQPKGGEAYIVKKLVLMIMMVMMVKLPMF